MLEVGGAAKHCQTHAIIVGGVFIGQDHNSYLYSKSINNFNLKL